MRVFSGDVWIISDDLLEILLVLRVFMSHPNVTRDVLLPPVGGRGMLQPCLAIDHVRAARDHLTSAVGILQGLIKGVGMGDNNLEKNGDPPQKCVCVWKERVNVFIFSRN